MTKTVYLIAASLVLGCGGSGGDQLVSVDSDLVGVYQIDRYQTSEEGCTDPTDRDPPGFLVLYGFREEGSIRSRLGGAFCSDVEACRQVAREAAVPAVGYIFSVGDDENGWFGWGVSDITGLGAECVADVQSHMLTTTGSQEIRAETKTVQTRFMAMLDGTVATCILEDAIAAIDDQPCREIIILDATFEANL